VTTFPGSPKLTKGGLVLIAPDTGATQRVISFQYNPETLSRTLAVQGIGAESGDRVEAFRLKGPPVETIKIDIQIDAIDNLGQTQPEQTAVDVGIFPELAALELIVYPTSTKLQQDIDLALAGKLEIIPAEAPLVLFVWSKNRILPVRLTEMTITEEMFDVALNPISAKVSLGMRVLSVNDLPTGHKGVSLYLGYQQQKEKLATKRASAALSTLGIQQIP
jgi:hypothetical protein